MKTFELRFPGGYNTENPYDDNFDVYIIINDKEVYMISLFTINNIRGLMGNNENSEVYFWSSDMLIVRSLKINDIEKAISEIIRDEIFDVIATKVGTVEEIFGE